MTQQQFAVIQEGVTLSLAGKIPFAKVVANLVGIGLERYHCDYTRQEKMFYMPDGDSVVVPMLHDHKTIAKTFSAQGIEKAIRAIQHGEIVYTEFLRQTMEAGCVGYFVQITGRQAQYFGRNGEVFVEPFPSKT